MQIGRRVIFEKTTGKVIVDFGEMQGDVLEREIIGELEIIDYPYGQNIEEFSRVRKWHVDPVTKQPVFDELEPVKPKYEELENELLLMADSQTGGIL